MTNAANRERRTLIFRREQRRRATDHEALSAARSFATIPLSQAALCMDCESVFSLSQSACPRCACRSHLTLACLPGISGKAVAS